MSLVESPINFAFDIIADLTEWALKTDVSITANLYTAFIHGGLLVLILAYLVQCDSKQVDFDSF